MRQAHIVSYDISDPKRLRLVYRAMRGFGDHLQLSVFRCELNARELVELRACLSALIHHGEDQVLIIDIGPADGRGSDAIESIGRAYTHPEHVVLVM